MGTPDWTRNASGLFTLVRSTNLSDKEWLKIIEARVAMVQPHLYSFTLSQMEETDCLYSENHLNDLRGNRPPIVTGDGSFSLEDQGIFGFAYKSRERYEGTGYVSLYSGGTNCPNGHLYIWGLTRKNTRWVLAKLEWKGQAGYKNRGHEQAFCIHFQEATLPEIRNVGKVSYPEIWRRLGMAIRGWKADRERLYNQARDMYLAVEAEEKALEVMRENLAQNSQ